MTSCFSPMGHEGISLREWGGGRISLPKGLGGRYGFGEMRILGIDGGSRRVGVALSDELGLTAQPVTTLSRGSNRELIEALQALIGDEEIELVVVGLPLRLDGSEGGAARKARRLAKVIADELNLPTELWDERFTSVQAERLLIDAGVRRQKRRGPTDRIAAAIMLQSFLDARGSQNMGGAT